MARAFGDIHHAWWCELGSCIRALCEVSARLSESNDTIDGVGNRRVGIGHLERGSADCLTCRNRDGQVVSVAGSVSEASGVR